MLAMRHNGGSVHTFNALVHVDDVWGERTCSRGHRLAQYIWNRSPTRLKNGVNGFPNQKKVSGLLVEMTILLPRILPSDSVRKLINSVQTRRMEILY